MSKHKIPCIRCLLRDLDQKAALKQVTAYRERLPVQQRANKELFEERLSICRDCKRLRLGVCQKSGYYVEASAYDKTKHCPLGTKIW